jgi:DNA mismatch endonuclease (patch repair protein)
VAQDRPPDHDRGASTSDTASSSRTRSPVLPASAIARANRRRDTKPEILLRRALHRRGLRFRKDFAIRAGDVLVRADVVFTRRRLVVFVDGCFWP